MTPCGDNDASVPSPTTHAVHSPPKREAPSSPRLPQLVDYFAKSLEANQRHENDLNKVDENGKSIKSEAATALQQNIEKILTLYREQVKKEQDQNQIERSELKSEKDLKAQVKSWIDFSHSQLPRPAMKSTPTLPAAFPWPSMHNVTEGTNQPLDLRTSKRPRSLEAIPSNGIRSTRNNSSSFNASPAPADTVATNLPAFSQAHQGPCGTPNLQQVFAFAPYFQANQLLAQQQAWQDYEAVNQLRNSYSPNYIQKWLAAVRDYQRVVAMQQIAKSARKRSASVSYGCLNLQIKPFGIDFTFLCFSGRLRP